MTTSKEQTVISAAIRMVNTAYAPGSTTDSILTRDLAAAVQRLEEEREEARLVAEMQKELPTLIAKVALMRDLASKSGRYGIVSTSETYLDYLQSLELGSE